MESIWVALAFILFCIQAAAEPVPGTSVDIKPPPGFVKSNRFAGFMQESTGSSIFKKWILAVDRSGSTILVVASYPNAASEQQKRPLKTAILNTTFGKQTDPMDALSFTVKPQAPFKIAKVMGQALILSPNGQFPIKDENVPFMIVGLSTTEDLAVADKKAYAERRITQTATVKNIQVQQSRPATIGSLTGYSTLAEGRGEGAATPLTIYQVILFDTSGYCLMQGVTPKTKRAKYLPVFRKMAKTFKMKKPNN